MTTRRDMTVGELRDLLAEYPDYMPVVPFVNKMAGVLLAVRPYTEHSGTILLIGECDLPMDLIENPREVTL